MNFAERLSDARKNAHLTQDQLAERLDVSRQTVSKWEAGQAQPEAGRIAALADALGVTCDALLRDETPQTVQAQMTGNNSFTIDWASLYPILTRYQSEMEPLRQGVSPDDSGNGGYVWVQLGRCHVGAQGFVRADLHGYDQKVSKRVQTPCIVMIQGKFYAQKAGFEVGLPCNALCVYDTIYITRLCLCRQLRQAHFEIRRWSDTMDYNLLAEKLFPHITKTPEDILAQYPARQLPEGAKVTRMGPSPTGFMHLGNLYGALVDERLAHQSGGVFYLRIEDTDKKREVEGGVQTIIDAFTSFGLPFDEGATMGEDRGAYGPYRQSQRAEIYQTFVKSLVQRGMAYPCFATEEELAAMREKQEAAKENFGYYGKYAVWRDRPMEDIEAELAKGTPYVVRFRSEGSIEHKVRHEDLVKGKMEVTENDQDVVILKSDGIPTYHFAHVVDDHLMGTTVVVRGEEWLATLPVHLQLFRAMGWKAPKYAHTAQLMKIDEETGSKRKLSKRKDPELALTFYNQQGYPAPSVLEYLMTLLNSNFEEWRRANPDKPMNDFPFSTKKMSGSGALFDIDKLKDVSKNVISRMSAEEVYDSMEREERSRVPRTLYP